MSGTKISGIVVAVCLAVSGIVLLAVLLPQKPAIFRGAVITQDADPAKQLPVGGVQITIQSGTAMATGKSDETGFFSIPLPRQIEQDRAALLRFAHPDYEPLDVRANPGDELYVARLVPSMRAQAPPPGNPIKIDNVVAQYSVHTTTSVNVGSAVKTFQVINKGNVPCATGGLCSPDGKWKAAAGEVVLDAGTGNEFHNARASCIAGPCPFTRIQGDFARDTQTLRVSALDWSDTATFLIEAEVYHPTINSVIRQSFPVIFEGALTFVLPASAEGVSIEAQLNGSMIVFPLGPALYLSWANCQMVINKDGSRVYRCELKPGYRLP